MKRLNILKVTHKTTKKVVFEFDFNGSSLLHQNKKVVLLCEQYPTKEYWYKWS